MPSRSKRLLSVMVIAGSVSLLTLGCTEKDEKALAEIAKINTYLGTSQDKTNTTLLGNINSNNEYLRKVIQDLQCDIWKLENPNKPAPTPCPPGGPSTSPTVVPKYPG